MGVWDLAGTRGGQKPLSIAALQMRADATVGEWTELEENDQGRPRGRVWMGEGGGGREGEQVWMTRKLSGTGVRGTGPPECVTTRQVIWGQAASVRGTFPTAPANLRV